jgi:very-short-patch-repair endonuclease
MRFNDAKTLIKKLGITSVNEYNCWYSRVQHETLPSLPPQYYKAEWISWYDFLSKDISDNMSVGERKIKTYLDRKNIEFVYQKKYVDCCDVNPLPFDFYLPKYNLIIEYDGRQHTHSIRQFGGEKYLQYTQKHDKIKNEYCAENNINILSISYTELYDNTIEWGLDLHIDKLAAEIAYNSFQ